MWSDEKKFNLDGPDGLAYYWHDLRTEPRYFSKRNFSGGSVMIWAGFSAFGKTTLAFVDGRINSIGYQKILADHLLPYFDRFRAENLTFMHDNASVHASASTNKWISDRNIPLLEWPARSPDINPIENLWGQLVRDVYDNCRQYNTTNELKKAIQKAWDRVTLNQLTNLANSMPKRVNLLIKNRGKSIKYESVILYLLLLIFVTNYS